MLSRSSREGDNLRSKLLKARLNLDNLRGAETTAHPFLVTELVIRNARDIIIRRVRMVKGEPYALSR